jgi:hypothetical protein
MEVFDYFASVQAEPGSFLLMLALSAGAMAIFNKLAFGHFLSGLFMTQLASVFAAAVVGDLYQREAITGFGVAHFFLVEGVAFLVIAVLYKRLLRIGPDLVDAVIAFHARYGRALQAALLILAAVNVVSVPGDGQSRILPQTTYWFSFLRPLQAFAIPAATLAAVTLLSRERYRSGLFLFFLVAAVSISSGSRASFVIGAVFWALVLRDLDPSTRMPRLRILVPVGILLALLAALNLRAAGMGAPELIDRFVAYGDAVIMVYTAPEPTAACAGVSPLAKLHRGLARLAGDASARDLDTLFGFALSIIHFGDNTFTGPNARLGPYALCAFPSWSIFAIAAMLALYVAVIVWIAGPLRMRMASPAFTALVLPFAIGSLNSFTVDYYQGVSDLTSMAILLLLLSARELALRAAPRHVDPSGAH